LLGPIDYLLWCFGFFLEASVVVCALYRKDFLKYLSLCIYMVCAASVNLGQFICLEKYGFGSTQYLYCYYYTESILTIAMFCVVIQLYQYVFVEMSASRYIRSAGALLLLVTAIVSYAVVRENQNHLTSRFVVELGQNLHFSGVVLTYLLWGAVLKLRETRTRLIQLVLALGVYFSATAGVYALRNLFPVLQPSLLRWVPPMVGVWLPLAWAYTLYYVPEDARLATARLMVRAR
jgi:hypothetical protein